jgi:hypothetical protein
MAGRTAATAARAATSSSKPSPGLNTLIDFRYKQHFKAQRGMPGAGKNRYRRGRRGPPHQGAGGHADHLRAG